ncbi:MAG: hypothetical protein SFT90_03635 [Rickettsiales bacterium]|nr:hypothetical protein [Rickettsiales bacterium]
MNIPIFLLAGVFMLLTLFTCTIGIVLMATGGEKNKKYGTSLMAARVGLQGISLALVALAFIF